MMEMTSCYQQRLRRYSSVVKPSISHDLRAPRPRRYQRCGAARKSCEIEGAGLRLRRGEAETSGEPICPGDDGISYFNPKAL